MEALNTFDNSLTESETFCFDLEENSSGSTTTLSDDSLPDYESSSISMTIILREEGRCPGLKTRLTKISASWEDFPDCDDSRARGFVLHSQELHILSFILGIRYPNLID
ncbi:hypothetical protein Tco_0760518 [Tanacetum coccineum]